MNDPVLRSGGGLLIFGMNGIFFSMLGSRGIHTASPAKHVCEKGLSKTAERVGARDSVRESIREQPGSRPGVCACARVR